MAFKETQADAGSWTWYSGKDQDDDEISYKDRPCLQRV